MSKESSPVMAEWKALYDAAIEFRKIKPWEWVKETDVFGVQNPQTGEVGYCCVMGELGEVLAMAVYHGTEGLNGYKKILKNEVKPGDKDSLFIQDCLIVMFENKRFVEKEDIKLINKLGYALKGKNAWPVFKSYKPGFFPWILNRGEAVYMTEVLKQARDMCLRLKENSKLLRPPKKHVYLIRVAEAADGGLIWKDAWKKPAPLKKRDYLNYPVNEIRIQRIRNSVQQSPVVWEIDSFYAPTPVKEEGRPYFPYAMMVADQDTGFIHDVYLAPFDKYMKDFPERFLYCMEKTSVVPMEILVRREEIMKLFEPYTAKLHIQVSEVKKLRNIDNARRSMMNFFSQ